MLYLIPLAGQLLSFTVVFPVLLALTVYGAGDLLGYAAFALATVICGYLGGGVMQQKHLFPLIHKKTLELLNGYVQHEAILEHIDTYITEPGLGTRSGATGALLLAKKAAGLKE